MIRIDSADRARLFEGWLMIDDLGQPATWAVSGPHRPLLVVEEVTDAVKAVSGRTVSRALDREALWSVVGFAVGRDVVDSLTAGDYDPSGLIEAVRDAGHSWSTLRVASS